MQRSTIIPFEAIAASALACLITACAAEAIEATDEVDTSADAIVGTDVATATQETSDEIVQTDASTDRYTRAMPSENAWNGHHRCGFGKFFGAPRTNNFRKTWTRIWRSNFKPVHRVQDLVLNTDDTGLNVAADPEHGLVARFKYDTNRMGTRSVPREEASFWIQLCNDQGRPEWTKVGESVLTDDNGFARFSIPGGLVEKGDYPIAVQLNADGSFAEGTLAVWPRGTQAIAIDVDGTMNTSNEEFFKDLLNLRADPIPNAPELFKLYADRGYKLVYLTGRPPRVLNRTREFADTSHFPHGIFVFAPERRIDTMRSEVPVGRVGGTRFGIGLFKKTMMEQLNIHQGVEWFAAYGDVPSDAWAYAHYNLWNDGAPQLDHEHIWIRGDHDTDLVELEDRFGQKIRQLKSFSSSGKPKNYAEHIEKLESDLDRLVPIANR